MGDMLNVFAFDPGDKNIGVCFLKSEIGSGKADIKLNKILDTDGTHNFLKTIWTLTQVPGNKCVFVVENFRVDSTVRGAMFQWNEMLTSRMIGGIEMLASWTESPFILQEPAILGNAKKWWPWKLPKGHLPDDVSAAMHGIHFLMGRKMIRTIEDVTWYGQEKIG